MLTHNYPLKNKIVIKGHVSVIEENVLEGELDELNSYNLDQEQLVINNLTDILELHEIKLLILEVLNNILFEQLTDKNIFDRINIYENKIFCSQQINFDYDQPSDDEIKSFKNNLRNLCVQDICLEITINDINIDCNDLITILKLS